MDGVNLFDWALQTCYHCLAGKFLHLYIVNLITSIIFLLTNELHIMLVVQVFHYHQKAVSMRQGKVVIIHVTS